MAGPIVAILTALARAVWRDARSVGSFASGNFFVAAIYFLRKSGVFLYALLALMVFVPLTADPLGKAPRDRMALFPLTRRQRWTLRAASLALSPAAWIALACAILVGVRSGAHVALAAALLLVVGLVAGHAPDRKVARLAPPLPPLARKNVRELMAALDFWFAVLMSAATTAFHYLRGPLPEISLVAMSVIITYSLSSFAQTLFGMESDAAMVRYALLPVRGWRLLLAKDVVFLGALCVVTAPLAPLTALCAGMAVLTVGHWPSVAKRLPQRLWRFSSGAGIPSGIQQLIAACAAAAAAQANIAIALIACTAAMSASLWFFGRRLERQLIEA